MSVRLVVEEARAGRAEARGACREVRIPALVRDWLFGRENERKMRKKQQSFSYTFFSLLAIFLAIFFLHLPSLKAKKQQGKKKQAPARNWLFLSLSTSLFIFSSFHRKALKAYAWSWSKKGAKRHRKRANSLYSSFFSPLSSFSSSPLKYRRWQQRPLRRHAVHRTAHHALGVEARAPRGRRARRRGRDGGAQRRRLRRTAQAAAPAPRGGGGARGCGGGGAPSRPRAPPRTPSRGRAGCDRGNERQQAPRLAPAAAPAEALSTNPRAPGDAGASPPRRRTSRPRRPRPWVSHPPGPPGSGPISSKPSFTPHASGASPCGSRAATSSAGWRRR